jgi:hypothetical protein
MHDTRSPLPFWGGAGGGERMLDAGCWILDPGCWIATGNREPEKGFGIQIASEKQGIKFILIKP